MASSTKTQSSYDVIPYISHSFSQTHPITLATVATLFGMSPPPVKECKVLELGCASGGNIIPMADALPESTIVGIDYSAKQVQQGQETIEALHLENVELRHESIMDVGADYGQFDYIICHGVFSWIANEIQEQIFQICRQNLAPEGVAYVSYNTYPGWHMRGMIRDMMLYHSGKFEEPARRIKEARALLGFLSESVPSQDSAYGVLLKSELELLRKQSDNYLFHDHLEEINEPMYFYQFVRRANEHRLAYLGEVDVSAMWAGNLGEKVQSTLKGVESDVIQTEQYMDFVRNRMFRQTLLCHAGQKIDRHINAAKLQSMYLTSHLTPSEEGAVVNDTSPVEYKSAGGTKITTTMPLLKAALVCLRQRWPQAIRFDELVEEAHRQLIGDDDSAAAPSDQQLQAMGQQLVKCYLAKLIEIAVAPCDFVTQLSPRPLASPMARRQAELGKMTTNRRHQSVQLTDLLRFVLRRLDGSHDADALVEALLEATNTGEVTIKRSDGGEIDDVDQRRSVFANDVRKSLAGLAQRALLVA